MSIKLGDINEDGKSSSSVLKFPILLQQSPRGSGLK
jgi:hypothetical protein